MPCHLEVFTPPQTPRGNYTEAVCSPGLPPAPTWRPAGVAFANDFMDLSAQLGRALCKNSTTDIQHILDADPDMASMPISMPKMELPICAAVRLQCDLEVIELLLDRGAKVNMVNSYGQNPLSVLASSASVNGWSEGWGIVTTNDAHENQSSEYQEKERWVVNVAVQLLQAGCDTTEKDSCGKTPVCTALESGWPKLSGLIREYQNFKTCLMLKICDEKRSSNWMAKSMGCFEDIPSHLLFQILEFASFGSVGQVTDQLHL